MAAVEAGAADARPARPRPALGPWPALEGLRGVAIVAVVAGHLGEFVLQDQADVLLPGGFLGVDLFLVLSGFLITALLLREVERSGSVRLGRFWKRRLTRLYPSLLVFLAAYLLYAWQQGQDLDPRLRIAGLSVVFLANWQFVLGVVDPKTNPVIDLSHLWSLSVEGQFYLIWPLAMLALNRFVRRTAAIVALLVLLTLAVMVLRDWQYFRYGDWILVYTRTDSRFDAFALGAIVAVLWARGLIDAASPALVRGLSVIGFGGLVVLFAVVHTPTNGLGGASAEFLFRGGFTLVALCSALAIVGAIGVGGTYAGVLAWGPLRLAGRASYSIYLFHLPVFVWSLNHVSNPAWRAVVALVGTLVTGGACYLAVERPVLRRRGRA